MTVTRAACFPGLTLTIHAQQAETLCVLFREEANRLEALEAPSIMPQVNAMRAVIEDVEKVLNDLDEKRAAWIEDHG